MKNDAGTSYLSSRRRMRGRPSMAPYSPWESSFAPSCPRASEVVALSTSKLNATATRAPPGQDFGFSLRPALMRNICSLSSPMLSFVPGKGLGDCAAAIAQTRPAIAKIRLIMYKILFQAGHRNGESHRIHLALALKLHPHAINRLAGK